MEVTETETRSPSISSIRAAILLSLPINFQPSMMQAKIHISGGGMYNPKCLVRMSRFEFKCSTILNSIQKTKNALAAISSQTSLDTHQNSANVVYIIVGSLILVLIILGSLFFFLVKRGRQVQNLDVVELTTCSSSTSTV